MDLTSPTQALCLLVVVGIVSTRTSYSALGLLGSLISFVIDIYLSWRYPIQSFISSDTIPTCAYRWPNGQGDIAKFIHGLQNSELWRKQHGSIYRIWSGTSQEIVLTKPEHVREVFKDSDTHSKAINSDAGWLFGELLGQCVGLVSGAEWRQVRACLGSGWTHKSAVSYLPQIIEITSRHFTQLRKSGGLKQGLLNPVADLRLLPFWISVDQIYGPLTVDLKHELEELIPIRESLFFRVVQGGLTRYSWSRYLPTQTNRDLDAFKKRWTRFNDAAHTACLLIKKRVPVVEMYEQVQKGAMTSEQMLQTLDEILFANLDVTIGGLSWNIVFLAMHPSVQSEMRNEIAFSRLDGKESNKHSHLLGSDTVLATSILESARLKPLAPFTVPQAAPTSRTIDGYLIPANTNYVSRSGLRISIAEKLIHLNHTWLKCHDFFPFLSNFKSCADFGPLTWQVIDSHALNLQSPVWGEDAVQYRPSRFLELKASDLRYNYWRFGFGPRQCIGKHIAELIIRVVVAHVVENYHVSMQDGISMDRNPASWITQPNMEVFCIAISS